MSKLLVNAPSGAQELIEVGEGGGYFDAARVLWDERTDGPLPAITLGGMVRVGNALVFDAAVFASTSAADVALKKHRALLKIDADADAIYSAVVGSRAQEYELAEKHAQEYTAAGYTGTVPSGVQSWATAKGWTGEQAAADILTTSAQWRTAQAAVRAERLLRKEQVRTATDAAGITAAMSAWNGFVTYMRGQLAI
jgi:hypothetical protein